MGRIAEAFEEKHRDKLIACIPYVIRFCRIDPSRLATHGWALIEANAALKGAFDEVNQIRQTTREELRGIPEEEKERREALMAERAFEMRVRRLAAIYNNPESKSAMVDRCTRVLVHSVTGMGEFLPEALEQHKDALHLGRLLDDHGDPSQFLVDQRTDKEREAGVEPYWIHPVQMVATKEEADPSNGRFWVGLWDPDLRITLGSRILDLQSVGDELVPFRFGSGAGPVPGSGGTPVRGEAQRAAGRVRSGARAGDRPALRKGGKEGRNRGREG